MSKTLENILLKNIKETYDGNTISPEYGENYLQKLLKARKISDYHEDDIVDYGYANPEDLYANLVSFTQHGEDEMTIEFGDGESITIDKLVAKELITSVSSEEITKAADDSYYMHQIIQRMYDEVVTINKNEDNE